MDIQNGAKDSFGTAERKFQIYHHRVIFDVPTQTRTVYSVSLSLSFFFFLQNKSKTAALGPTAVMATCSAPKQTTAFVTSCRKKESTLSLSLSGERFFDDLGMNLLEMT